MSNFYLPKQSARNPYFDALVKEGTNTSPIGAHSQGMSRLAFAMLAGLERSQMDRADREEREYRKRMGTEWKGRPQGPARRVAMPSAITPDPESDSGSS
jgi:hypothetical protein